MLKSLIFIEILVAIGTAIFYYSLNRQMRREIGTLPGIVFGTLAVIGTFSPTLLIAQLAFVLAPIVLARTKVQAGIVVAVGFLAVPAASANLIIGGVWLFGWSFQSSIALGGLIALLLAPGKLAKARPETDLAMIVLILILVVVDARGGAVTGYLRTIAMYAFVYGVPVFAITRSARTAAERRTLLTGLAGAGVILAIIVIYEARGSWPLYAPMSQHYMTGFQGLVAKWRGGLLRAYGPIGEATAMGFVLVVCFAAAFASRRSFKSSLDYAFIVALIALGSLAPQSRGGIIGVAVAFILSSFYRRGVSSVAQIGAAATLLAGAYAGALFFGSQVSTSLTEAKGGDYRSQLLTRGMQEFWKNPLLGDTGPNVTGRMQDMVQGEGIVDFVNTYLYFALFSGGIGLVLFCIAFLIPIGRLIKIRPQLPPFSVERDIAGFCLALLGSAAVMLAFTSFLQRPTMYLLVASSLAMMIQIPQRVVRKREPEAPVIPVRDPQVA